jgi:hypothetical protein
MSETGDPGISMTALRRKRDLHAGQGERAGWDGRQLSSPGLARKRFPQAAVRTHHCQEDAGLMRLSSPLPRESRGYKGFIASSSPTR